MKKLLAALFALLLAAPAFAQGVSGAGGGGGSGSGVGPLTVSCGLSGGGSSGAVNVSGSAVLGNNGAAISGGTYSVQGSNATHPDCGTTLLFTGSTSTWTLAQAGTTGFAAGFGFSVNNSGSGAITLNVTTSDVYPPAAGVTSIVIPPGEGLGIQSDGTNYELNWWSLGLGGEVPNCPDSGGNHVNYTASTNAFSCGTSGSGGIANFVVYGSGAAKQAQNTTLYYFVEGISSSTGTEANTAAPAGRSATFTFGACFAGVAPGTGNSITYTFRDGQASPGGGTVCTVANGATTGTVTGSGVAVTVNQQIDVQVVTSASLGTTPDAIGWALLGQ